VEVRYDLATARGDDLIVLHVIPETDAEPHLNAIEAGSRRGGTAQADVSISHARDRATRFAAAVVDKSLGEYESGRVTPTGRVGTPKAEILAVADELDVQYLVIGGRRQSAVGMAQYGSTAQSVVLDTLATVVTVIE